MKIKPLEWTKKTKYYEGSNRWPETYEICYEASNTFGSFSVGLASQHEESEFTTTSTWNYCFDEFYDENHGSCKSLLAGKRFLEQLWTDRLMTCLE